MRDADAKGFSTCPFCGYPRAHDAFPLIDWTPWWERTCYYCKACRHTFNWVLFIVGGQVCWPLLELDQPGPGEQVAYIGRWDDDFIDWKALRPVSRAPARDTRWMEGPVA